MLYLVALFIPPLGILFAGRILTSIVVAVIWLPTTILLLFPHLIFVCIAWLVIAQARGDRRHREMMAAIRKKDDELNGPRS